MRFRWNCTFRRSVKRRIRDSLCHVVHVYRHSPVTHILQCSFYNKVRHYFIKRSTTLTSSEEKLVGYQVLSIHCYILFTTSHGKEFMHERQSVAFFPAAFVMVTSYSSVLSAHLKRSSLLTSRSLLENWSGPQALIRNWYCFRLFLCTFFCLQLKFEVPQASTRALCQPIVVVRAQLWSATTVSGHGPMKSDFIIPHNPI